MTEYTCSQCGEQPVEFYCPDENCAGQEGFCRECAPVNTIDGEVCPYCGKELFEEAAR